MMTSCSPGWIKFVEEFYPDLIPHLSTCKSPQQMLGAVIKSFFAEREKIDPARIFSVADHAVHGQEVRGGPIRRWPATAVPTSTRC